MLRSLKHDAEAALGQPVEEAVITVPAYFDETQRHATRDAGAIAGLRVERIINEPTAAALAYGLHERHREMRAVVLDLGGGTFDVTVLEIIEGVIEIQASAGDSRLGGEDFAEALAAAVAEQPSVPLETLRADPRSWARLLAACEEAKRALTGTEAVRVALPDLPIDGRPRSVDATITRAEAEVLWAPLLDRLRAPTLRALRDAGLGPASVDEVLLVGGATRMPCVVRLAAQIFGRVPLGGCRPTRRWRWAPRCRPRSRRGTRPSTTWSSPTSRRSPSASRSRRSSAGSRSGAVHAHHRSRDGHPGQPREAFSTMSDNQKQIDVEVFQGEHSLCENNRKLGQYSLRGLPPGPAGSQSIDVRFTYDLNGLLEVDMTILSTGKRESLVVEQTPGRLTASRSRTPARRWSASSSTRARRCPTPPRWRAPRRCTSSWSARRARCWAPRSPASAPRSTARSRR